MKKPKLSKKLLLSLAALGTAGALAGMGTFAQYTSTASAPESVTTGIVNIALGATGPANRLSVSATHVVPGDTIARAVDLISTSTDPLSSVTLTTTASPSSALDTDTTNGLQVVIQTCPSGAWTEAGSSPAFTYTCSGGASTVLATRAVIGSALALSNLTATTTANTTDHLVITLTLPSATTAVQVPNSASSTINYDFTGIQRAATNR